jgi:xanthine dehydrogenase molybdopterin-binding subunit B
MLSDQAKRQSTDTGFAGPQAAASHEREMQEWARSLGIAPAKLKQAVSAVGITPRKIREYLRSQRE